MNFWQLFEEWHTKTFGYIPVGTGTAMHRTYSGIARFRWEGWQANEQRHILNESKL